MYVAPQASAEGFEVVACDAQQHAEPERPKAALLGTRLA